MFCLFGDAFVWEFECILGGFGGRFVVHVWDMFKGFREIYKSVFWLFSYYIRALLSMTLWAALEHSDPYLSEG